MKLDINKINELENEKEMLEKKENVVIKLAEAKAKSYDFNEWYGYAKDSLSKIHDRRTEIENEIITIKATNINVGDGISLSPYTDWYAFTVIERKETPKGFVLTVQEDDAIRTDNYGMSDCQSYRYERNEKGRTMTVKWNTKKNWFTCDCYRISLGRHAYYDYTY